MNEILYQTAAGETFTLAQVTAQLDELYSIRYMLNEQLNIIKDQNRHPANRTMIRGITALLIYNRMIEAQAQITKLESFASFTNAMEEPRQ